MRQLNRHAIKDVSGGALDWGDIMWETVKGAATGGSLGHFTKVARFVPYGAVIAGAIGGANAGYDEVIRQIREDELQKP